MEMNWRELKSVVHFVLPRMETTQLDDHPREKAAKWAEVPNSSNPWPKEPKAEMTTSVNHLLLVNMQSSRATKHVESAKALELSARLMLEHAKRTSHPAQSLLDASKREVRASKKYLKKARVQGDCNVPSTCADVQLSNWVKVQRTGY